MPSRGIRNGAPIAQLVGRGSVSRRTLLSSKPARLYDRVGSSTSTRWSVLRPMRAANSLPRCCRAVGLDGFYRRERIRHCGVGRKAKLPDSPMAYRNAVLDFCVGGVLAGA